MAFKRNNAEQISIDDSFDNLSPRTKKIVENSRSNAPVNFIIGALILKELNGLGLSDEQLIESICCDIRYQYALYTTSLEDQPVSDRTFSRFRERLCSYEKQHNTDLLREEMTDLASKFKDFLSIHSGIKRMDSLMVASNCKNMTRLEIIYTVVANCIRLINKTAKDSVPDQMKHYLKDDNYNKTIYYADNDTLQERLDKAFGDALVLRDLMNDDRVIEGEQYRLLLRVIDEQSVKDDDGHSVLKDKSDIKPTSLQNPSDPDATYRKKYGDNEGYVANVVETVDDETGRSIISDAQYEQNIYADTKFAQDYIESKDDDKPEILVTDAGFESDENRKKAADKNIRLVSTDLKGKSIPYPVIAEFTIEDGKVVKCPQGKSR